LYNLILRSRKPQAVEFKRWITHEVLPQIEKTGGYIPVKQGDTDKDIMARGYLVAIKTVEERDRQRQVIAEGELLTLPAIGVWVRSVRDSHVTDSGKHRLPCPSVVRRGSVAVLGCVLSREKVAGENRLYCIP